MQKAENKTTYFFVDEAGDPIFYNKFGQIIVGKEGCSKILLLGFIKTMDPEKLRKEILKLRGEIVKDKYLQGVPSMEKTLRSFHATDDIPEIREKVFKLITQLNFTAEFIIARKKEEIFQKRHNKKENIFYDDLIAKLFENKLHKTEKNVIYFAVRGSKPRQAPLNDAIQTAILMFEKKWKTKVNSEIVIFPQTPSGEPCLQITDYMNWAVQRVFQKGEDRYVKFVQDKISYLVDLYDFDNYPRNFYNRKNQFDINKISPL